MRDILTKQTNKSLKEPRATNKEEPRTSNKEQIHFREGMYITPKNYELVKKHS